MALPLLWLGGAVLGAGLLLDELARQRQLAQKRLLGKAPAQPVPGSNLGLAPGLLHWGMKSVRPVPGAIVCCHVFGVIEHTGIWLGDNTLIELHGSGLIRAVSVNRFLAGRSGSKIFLACNHRHQPLIDAVILERAERAIFQYREYDLFDNNCHRFVWLCLSGQEDAIPSFIKLNNHLAGHFGEVIYWDEAKLQ